MNEQELELNEGKLMDFLIRVFSGKKVPTMSEKLMDLVTQKMAQDKEFDDLVRNGTTANGFKTGYKKKFIEYVKNNMDGKAAREILGKSSIEDRMSRSNSIYSKSDLEKMTDEQKIAANLNTLANKMATVVSRHARRDALQKQDAARKKFLSKVNEIPDWAQVELDKLHDWIEDFGSDLDPNNIKELLSYFNKKMTPEQAMNAKQSDLSMQKYLQVATDNFFKDKILPKSKKFKQWKLDRNTEKKIRDYANDGFQEVPYFEKSLLKDLKSAISLWMKKNSKGNKMNENITDFISAVVADKPHAALNAFSEVMAEKVSEALDSKYIEVAQTMFNVAEAKVMKKKMNVGDLEVEMEVYSDGSGEIDISDEDGVIYSEDSGNVKTWISSIEKMIKKKDMAMFAGDLKKVVAELKKFKITREEVE